VLDLSHPTPSVKKRQMVTVSINGQAYQVDLPSDMPLLWHCVT
jgi:hypothetical protein